MSRVCAFSICSNNYLPHLEVLFASVRKFHPDVDLYVCLVDEETGTYGPYTVIGARNLGIPEFESFCFQYTIIELNTAVKPFMFMKLFEQLAYDHVIYLDPDIELFAPLTPVFEALNEGASFILTPHLLEPAENDAQPDDIQIMRAGTYNLGFLACSAQEETQPILRWWARRLRHQCVNEKDRGVFVDQKFMDLLPGFADRVRILRDPGLNVAYWNLKQRKLRWRDDGWLVNDTPLRFFHFSGIDLSNRSILSAYTHHFRGDEIDGSLQKMIDDYAGNVRSHAANGVRAPGYAYGRFASGTPIHAFVRQMFREFHVPWVGNPFENYEAFLHKPALGTNRDSSAYVITNLMHYCWQRFPYLKHKYNLETAKDVKDFTHWYLDHALTRWKFDPRLVEPVATRAGRLPKTK